MFLDTLSYQFHGFHPSDFTRDYLTSLLEEIRTSRGHSQGPLCPPRARVQSDHRSPLEGRKFLRPRLRPPRERSRSQNIRADQKTNG